MSLVELIVYILATWRLTSLLVDEDGPYGVFDWLRYKAGVAHDSRNERYGRNEFAKGMICPWCVSVWIGCVLSLSAIIWPDVMFWVALPFALSAGAIFLHRRI